MKEYWIWIRFGILSDIQPSSISKDYIIESFKHHPVHGGTTKLVTFKDQKFKYVVETQPLPLNGRKSRQTWRERLEFWRKATLGIDELEIVWIHVQNDREVKELQEFGIEDPINT